jgi:hypothetical protein
MFSAKKATFAASVVLSTLLLLPAPLLPPYRFAEAVQSILGINRKGAYLAAAIGLHLMVYGALGLVTAFAIPPASTRHQRWAQLLFVPLGLVLATVIIRSVKLGHLPVLANALLPILACLLGAALGLVLSQKGWRAALGATAIALAGLGWALFPSVSSGLSRETQAQLRRLVADADALPLDHKRFGVLLQTVFTPSPSASVQVSPMEHNRAAIVALGIAIGHERLARFVGLTHQNDLVRAAIALRPRTTLDGREDWARHFCLSAALAVLENPFLSDAGGLMKEQLDALTHGSGFSFGDLTADRAGVRFAEAATDSAPAAKAMQARLQEGYSADDFFPPASDLPENLTVEQFRRDYGGVGDQRYRLKIRQIEARLDRCPGLSLPKRHSG